MLETKETKELLNLLRPVSKLASLPNIYTYLKETSMEMFLSIQWASNLANPLYVSQIEATKNRHSNGSQNSNSAPSVPQGSNEANAEAKSCHLKLSSTRIMNNSSYSKSNPHYIQAK
jgi:hypothetical protein